MYVIEERYVKLCTDLYYYYVRTYQGFFFSILRYSGFPQTSSLGKNPLVGEKYGIKVLRFYSKNLHFCLNVPMNCRISEFSCEICLSLANLESCMDSEEFLELGRSGLVLF